MTKLTSDKFAVGNTECEHVWKRRIIVPVMLAVMIANILCRLQWVSGHAATVSLAPPGWSWRRVVQMSVQIVALLLPLAAVAMLLAAINLFLSVAVFILLFVWMAAASSATIDDKDVRKVVRSEGRAMRRDIGRGWTVNTLASDGTSVGEAFRLGERAAKSLPAGSVVFVESRTSKLAGLYGRYDLASWGPPGWSSSAVSPRQPRGSPRLGRGRTTKTAGLRLTRPGRLRSPQRRKRRR